jgi:hypothetical protein
MWTLRPHPRAGLPPRSEERLRHEVSVAFATDPVKSETGLKQQTARGQAGAEIELRTRYRRIADTIAEHDSTYCFVLGA